MNSSLVSSRRVELGVDVRGALEEPDRFLVLALALVSLGKALVGVGKERVQLERLFEGHDGLAVLGFQQIVHAHVVVALGLVLVVQDVLEGLHGVVERALAHQFLGLVQLAFLDLGEVFRALGLHDVALEGLLGIGPQDVARAARGQGVQDLGPPVLRGDHDHGRVLGRVLARELLLEREQEGDAVHVRELGVEQHQVGLVAVQVGHGPRAPRPARPGRRA